MSEYKAGDRVKFLPRKKPSRRPRTHGISATPQLAMLVQVNGQSAMIYYNQIYQVSDSIAPLIVKPANPFSLVNSEFLKKTKIKDRFKTVESKKGKKK